LRRQDEGWRIWLTCLERALRWKSVLCVAIGFAACSSSTEPSGPVPVQVLRIAQTTQNACLLTPAGEISCWGLGGPSQKVRPPEVSRFVSISGGIDHFCALAADSTAYCWGRNNCGELGDGTQITRDQPVRVATTLKFVSVRAAARASYALDPDGRAYSWRSFLNAALGNGQNSRDGVQLTPAPMATTVQFSALGWGCALSRAGRAYCWGTVKPNAPVDPMHVEAGDCRDAYWAYYEGDDCLVPTTVATSLRFKSIGGCGLTADDDAYCWGDGFRGELGDGRSGSPAFAIQLVAVALGIKFSMMSGRCGLDLAGAAWCWGNNAFGQLGIGVTGGIRSLPTAVLTGERFVEIVSNGNTCARTPHDAVWCWGSNDSGQLGPTFVGARSNVPVQVVLPP
jgi:alpha-tubulin suppressor-like RCC1 family protein